RSTNARELSGSVTSRLPSRREPTKTRAPAPSSDRAVAAPITLQAPATIARLPAREVVAIGGEVNARPTTRGAGGRLGLGDAASRGERPAQYQAHDRLGGAARAARGRGVREPLRA